VDQIDLTGPFEVLSRLPNSTYRIFGKTLEPVRDARGLRLTPDALLEEAPQLDVLHVPGGYGQEALMDNEEILSWVRNQARRARCVFSVCTGALICGAAGLLSVQNVLQKRAGHGKRLEVTKQPTMKRTTTRIFISIAFVSAKTMEMEVRPVGTSRDRSNIEGWRVFSTTRSYFVVYTPAPSPAFKLKLPASVIPMPISSSFTFLLI
jgi:DJ-1/PfpI family